jgi:ABC-2 type transport system ATP-binding protein
VHQPAILFLDEPTVGIDPALRVQFWGYFRDLAASGTTLLVASHVMDEADRCDELLLILHGRLLARGSGTEIREQAGVADLEGAFLKLGEQGPQS